MSKLINIKNIDKKEFKVINKSPTVAEITIYSDIGESFWDEGFSAKRMSEALKELSKTVNQIDVRINSFGGDVFEGLAIYNRLKQHSANITVYVDGIAASIASIIAMAGDKIVVGEGALLMIHKPMTGAYGNANELEDMISRLDDVEEQLVGIYRRKTGLDRSEIKNMLSKETWFDAKEALDLGFADEVMETEDAIKMVACHSKLPWAKNINITNVSSNAYIQKQITKFKQDAEALLTR